MKNYAIGAIQQVQAASSAQSKNGPIVLLSKNKTIMYIIYHIHEMRNDEEEGVKVLGIFSSLDLSVEVVRRYTELPGFSEKQAVFTDDEYDVGFVIDKVFIDQAYWEGGYTSTKVEEDDIEISAELSIPCWAKDSLATVYEKKWTEQLLTKHYGRVIEQESPWTEYHQLKLYEEVRKQEINTLQPSLEHLNNVSKAVTQQPDESTHSDSSLAAIYVATHFDKFNADIKNVGTFSSRARAEAVVAQYKTYKGFRDTLEGFYIDKYEVDKAYWTSGYYDIKVDKHTKLKAKLSVPH